MKSYNIVQNENVKLVSSADYKFKFNKQTGYFERWGKTRKL